MNNKVKVCLVSITVCGILAAAKYLIAISSGSMTLMADSLHSLLDMMTSSLVLLSIVVTGMEFKNRFLKLLPKLLEVIVFLTIIGLVSYFGLEIFAGLKGEAATIQTPFWVVLLSIISIIISHYLYRYQKKIGSEEKNVLILADAFETRMDQISSALVVLSILGFLMGMKSENTFVLIILGFICFNIILWSIETIFLIITSGKGKYKAHSDRFSSLMEKAFDGGKVFIKTHQKSFKYSSSITSIAMLIIYLLSGFYTLRPGQIALVQYFGEHIRSTGSTPGLNYSFPWPVSQKTILDVDEIKRIAMTPNKNRNLRYLITKDENLIDISVSMQYRISDPYKYVFMTNERKRIIEDLLEATATDTIGQFTIDDALVHSKQQVLNHIRGDLEKSIKKYDLGIHILNIQFKDNRPPREVIMAFNDVSSAREDKRTYIDKALGYKNQVLPGARGSAFQIEQQGEAFAKQIVLKSEGDATNLESIYKEYRNSPYTYKAKEFLKIIDQIGNRGNLEIIDSTAVQKAKIRITK